MKNLISSILILLNKKLGIAEDLTKANMKVNNWAIEITALNINKTN